jgi:hypothetical protein
MIYMIFWKHATKALNKEAVAIISITKKKKKKKVGSFETAV